MPNIFAIAVRLALGVRPLTSTDSPTKLPIPSQHPLHQSQIKWQYSRWVLEVIKRALFKISERLNIWLISLEQEPRPQQEPQHLIHVIASLTI